MYFFEKRLRKIKIIKQILFDNGTNSNVEHNNTNPKRNLSNQANGKSFGDYLPIQRSLYKNIIMSE